MPSKRKNRVLRKWMISISLIILTGSTIFLLVKQYSDKKPEYTRYPEFGIDIPGGYSIHGIDVSKYQSMIAWDEVKAMHIKNISLGFVFIKATEGIGNEDPYFRRNWKKAKDNRIPRGAYHFFIGSKDGRMQAEHFINNVSLEPGDLPPVLDVEQLNGSNRTQLKKEISTWLEIAEQYYKVKPIIYSNVDFYNRYLGKEFDSYPLWLAHYYQPGAPRISRDWIFWQHSDQGRVNGIGEKVDFNVFNGDSSDFRELMVK